ncbi:MAG: transposase [Promethearchaeota archaeon]
MKTLYLAFRKELEQKSKSFFKNHWALFFQPERLTPKRVARLKLFLEKYPQLSEYRQMTIMVGEIYRKPVDEIDGHEIDDLCIQSHYSDKLKTAIKTLKKNKTSILRFIEVFKRDRTLTKANRTSMEYENRRFKAPFRHGLNCTSKKHLIGKLKLQLTPDVRWFLDDTPSLNIQKT